MGLSLIRSQLDGELVLVRAQGKLTTGIEGLVEDDMPFILTPHFDKLSEEFQAAEDRLFLTAAIRHEFGIDDIKAT